MAFLSFGSRSVYRVLTSSLRALSRDMKLHRNSTINQQTRQTSVCLPALSKVSLQTPSQWKSLSNDSRTQEIVNIEGDENLVECSSSALTDRKDFIVVTDFVSEEEEKSLVQDISRTLRGKRYQYEHWDGAIEGYQETEKSHWLPENAPIISRLKSVVVAMTTRDVPLTPLPEVHVLDLAKDGFIKPHIDSVKYCGGCIAGISLLSSSVMRLEHEADRDRWILALLPCHSLYIMRGVARFDYTHALLADEESYFRDQHVTRDRRISIISRAKPQ